MSITVAELLDTPFGETTVTRVLPEEPREILRATFLERSTDLDTLRPAAVVVLGRAALTTGGSYDFDVLVRRAVERGVAVLLLRRSTRRSITAEDLAQRGQLALVDVSDDADPLDVFDWVGSTISGDTRAALARLAAAVGYDPRGDAEIAEVVREMSRLSGIALQLADAEDPGRPINVDGRYAGTVRAREQGHAATIAEYVTAAVISEMLTAKERNLLRPVRSTASALNQLLLSSQANLATASARAVEVGFDVDRWHCASRAMIELADDEGGTSTVEGDVFAFVAGRITDPHGSWTAARPDSSMVLVRTCRSDPGRRSADQMKRVLSQLAEEVRAVHPAARIRIGVGTPHHGAAGLRASAEEARIALASVQLDDRAVSVAQFDAVGLRRMLAEWLTSESARDSVHDLLAPLDRLGAEKAHIAIDTLHAYLDEHGSYQRAADRLQVHRNTVVYRIAQIVDALPVDITDPDTRFALQLACRARLVQRGTQ